MPIHYQNKMVQYISDHFNLGFIQNMAEIGRFPSSGTS